MDRSFTTVIHPSEEDPPRHGWGETVFVVHTPLKTKFDRFGRSVLEIVADGAPGVQSWKLFFQVGDRERATDRRMQAKKIHASSETLAGVIVVA